MKGILGQKIGMTQVFTKTGKLIPVTVIEVKPNTVVYTKTQEADGYTSTALAYGDIKAKNVNRPKAGIFQKAGIESKRWIKEIRNMEGYKSGDVLEANLFQPGEYVDVSGVSKGHGFSGVIKRWNFRLGPSSHGSGYHRGVGGLSGARGGTSAQRILKNKKMPGHYGTDNTTVQNLVVVNSIPEDNTILIKGSIPGPKKSLVVISQAIKKPGKSIDAPELINNQNQ